MRLGAGRRRRRSGGAGVSVRLDFVHQDGFEFGGRNTLVAILDLVGNVLTVLGLDEREELVGVFANDDGTEMASGVVPRDAVVVLVVEDRQASFVVVLLQALDRHADVEFSLDRTLFDAFEVIRLGFARLSGETPEGLRVWRVSSGDPGVRGSGPEPSVNVDGLQVSGVAPFALEVALASRGVDGTHVIFLHNFGEEFEFSLAVKADQVHATIAAKVPAVKPVPIFEFVPRFPPRQKVMVTFPFHM